MMEMAESSAPWGFYATADELPLDLTPHWLRVVQRAEAVARAEEADRQERIAERADRAHNMAIAVAMSRAHEAGEAWNPNDPLKHYPSTAERIEQGFAMADAMAAREARAARREAAKVLAAHGISGQITIDIDQVSPAAPAQAPAELPGESASRAVKSRIRRYLMLHPRQSVKDAHPIAGPDNWVPDTRSPDDGSVSRWDMRKYRR